MQEVIRPSHQEGNYLPNAVKVLTVFAILYLFLVSIGMIGTAFKGLGKGLAETLIASSAGPLIGLFICILATSLIQSSSTTTSLVVGMVAAGSFGQDPQIAVSAAVPIIMGANIGTSITNTIVSMGHVLNKNEFQRAFAASTVHDIFNVMVVIIIFPIEAATGFLSRSANALTDMFIGAGSVTFKSPVKVITTPAVHFMDQITHNQNLMNGNLLLALIALLLLFFSLRMLTKTIKSLVIQRLEAFFDTHIFKHGFVPCFLVFLSPCWFRVALSPLRLLFPWRELEY